MARRLRAWADAQPAVRAALLTGSRAAPDRRLDRWSDYDVVLFLAADHDLETRDDWLSEFGRIMVWIPEVAEHSGKRVPARLVQYADGHKIDFTLCAVEHLERMIRRKSLPASLATGYEVLVDKDGLAVALLEAEGRPHVPGKPNEDGYLAVVREFWWEALYVAKNLARGEPLPARYSAECVLRFGCLLPMLEWYVQGDGDWDVSVGAVGRGLMAILPAEDAAELEATFAGSDPAAGWDALFAAIRLFGRVARSVARRLGFSYPETTEAEVTDLIEAIRSTTG